MNNPSSGNIITSDDILGKEALDPDGEVIGVVMKLHIDRRNKQLVGVTIDQGFLKPDLFVGLESVERFGIDALFINRIALEKYHGVAVYSAGGMKIGEGIEGGEKKGALEMIRVEVEDKRINDVLPSKIATLGSVIILKE